jgi:hypothetical protein
MTVLDDLLAKLPTNLQLEGTSGGLGQAYSPGQIFDVRNFALTDISHDVNLSNIESPILASYVDLINQTRSAARDQAANPASIDTSRSDTRSSTPNTPTSTLTPIVSSSKPVSKTALYLSAAGGALLLGLGYTKRKR